MQAIPLSWELTSKFESCISKCSIPSCAKEGFFTTITKCLLNSWKGTEWTRLLQLLSLCLLFYNIICDTYNMTLDHPCYCPTLCLVLTIWLVGWRTYWPNLKPRYWCTIIESGINIHYLLRLKAYKLDIWCRNLGRLWRESPTIFLFLSLFVFQVVGE